MCGIAALVDITGTGSPSLSQEIRAMCGLVRHRGPDGEGYTLFADQDLWHVNGPDTPLKHHVSNVDERRPARVAMGHRRLAIVDLSVAGHQPMSDAAQRFWITYNGEIYNYIELRAELEQCGYQFVTGTDTEVLLAAYSAWGPACLARFNGMFAFVLYDRLKRCVFAARDRYGVKPLYMWRSPGGRLAFASEIKQFTALPGWRAQLDGQASYDYLVFGLTDHAGRSMFRDVLQLPAGGCVELPLDDIPATVLPRRWYHLPVDKTIDGDAADMCEQWRALFLDAVRLRLRSDAPVGTALSGGLDSSSIVCAVRQLRDSTGNVTQNAFSARVRDAALDEGRFMEAVVAQTGVRHHCVWPEPDDLFARLAQITWHMDEPFGSTSVFAEWRVFETVAQTNVKVTLDGHGGDEILAGYSVYPGPFLGTLLRRGNILALVREMLALASKGQPLAHLCKLLIDDVAPAPLRDALRRAAGRTVLRPEWLDLQRIGAVPHDPFPRGGGIAALSRSQLSSTSLPMQLRWNDRNSMASSIESRAPFLDVRLVELSLQLADHFKLSGGVSKWILRKALVDMLPRVILNRTDKIGFATPESIWARGSQSESFRAGVRRAMDRAGGILTKAAASMADDMLAGRRPYNSVVWRIISFGAWLDRFDVATDG